MTYELLETSNNEQAFADLFSALLRVSNGPLEFNIVFHDGRIVDLEVFKTIIVTSVAEDDRTNSTTY